MPKLTKSQLALRRAYPKRKKVVPVIKTLKKQVKHLMAVDRNQLFYDEHVATSVPLTTGVVTYLNPSLADLVFGAANDNDTTATLLVKHLRLSMDITMQSNSNVRIIIFKDTASRGTLPLVSDIISDNAGATGILYGRTVDNMSRYKILYDQVHHFLTSADNSATTVRCNKLITVNKSFKDLKMEFHVTSPQNTVIACQKNQLFMLQISSNANAAAGTFVSRITCEPPKASQ